MLQEKFEQDRLFRSRVRYSNIPESTYWTHRLQTFLPREGTGDAYQAALDFISGKAEHCFLTIGGSVGGGKTHLALGIGWHVLENTNQLVKFWHVVELLDELRRGFHADTEEKLYDFDELMKRIKEVYLLILDDLGVEQSTPWAREKLDLIVNHRYLAGMATVVTTNLDPGKLEPRIASRLYEGRIVVLECEGDYRKMRPRKVAVKEE